MSRGVSWAGHGDMVYPGQEKRGRRSVRVATSEVVGSEGFEVGVEGVWKIGRKSRSSARAWQRSFRATFWTPIPDACALGPVHGRFVARPDTNRVDGVGPTQINR